MKFISHPGQFLPGVNLKKVINRMRLSVILAIVSICCASASVSYSQTTEITLHLQNATIKEILDEIKQQSDFSFWYRNEDIDLNKKVSVDVNKQNINNILDKLLKEQNLSYTIDDTHIIIYKKASLSTPFVLQQSKRITGIITDERGDPIIGANVVEKGTVNGIITEEIEALSTVMIWPMNQKAG